MKAWIARDDDGTMCWFAYNKGKPPEKDGRDGWCGRDLLICEGQEAWRAHGNGLHGVRKGRKKLFEVTLTPVCEGGTE